VIDDVTVLEVDDLIAPPQAPGEDFGEEDSDDVDYAAAPNLIPPRQVWFVYATKYGEPTRLLNNRR
jgi:hypothetical protein